MTEINTSGSKPDRKKEARNDLVFSYMTLRNLIGFSGMLLPAILVLCTSKGETDKFIEPSISAYYYTSNGDVLVVLLSILGVFLFTYNGYNWKEKVLTMLAAICGLGVAFSPTATQFPASVGSVHVVHDLVPEIWGIERHVLFASTFFIALAIISLVYFPKSDSALKKNNGDRTQKGKRNIVFIACGWIMLGCVAVLGIYFLYPPFKNAVGDFPIIFVFEAIAIEAFGISWITKGETLWPDGEHYMTEGYRMAKEAVNKEGIKYDKEKSMRIRIIENNFSSNYDWLFKLVDEAGNIIYIMDSLFYKRHGLKSPVTRVEVDYYDTDLWISAIVEKIDEKFIVISIHHD